MKAPLLLATFVVTFALSAANSTDASDLRFAFSTLKSARNSYSRQVHQPVSTRVVQHEMAQPVAPQLLVGAFLEDVNGGLRVTNTLPGSPASEVLQSGDVIHQISALGQPAQTLESVIQFKLARQEIGPNRQAMLEVIRNGSPLNAWVTFRPAGELASFSPHPLTTR